jgi:hypothetical protein
VFEKELANHEPGAAQQCDMWSSFEKKRPQSGRGADSILDTRPVESASFSAHHFVRAGAYNSHT